MKLIIDIDERAYKGCMELKSNGDMGLLGLHLINATANGTPLEEELEKIKAEIECNMRKNNCDLYGYADSLVIIDKEIAVLKGE